MNSTNGKINFGVGLDNSQLRQDAAESKRILQELSQTSQKEGKSMEEALKGVGKAIAGVFAIDKIKDFAVQMATVRGEFQQLEIAFTTMLQSKSKADALMNQLIQTAATTPFGMNDVANSAKQLLAYGLEAEKVNETLIRLGDIAAGLSLPINDLAYLYGTTMVQGRMYTQDLNQFLGRGIPLAEELAKQFHTNAAGVKELVQAGKIGFPEVEKAIVAMTSQGSKFGGLMEAQSKTITGQISNLEDAIEQMFNELGKKSEGFISGAIEKVSGLVENYERVGRILLGLIITYGTYRTAVLLSAAATGWATKAEMLQYNWLLLCEKAQKLLNATMLKNPYVLIATLIAGVVAALISMKTEAERVKEKEQEYEEQKRKTTEAEEEHKRRIEELTSVAADEEVATDNRRKALIKLEKKYPDIFEKYDTEYEKLKNIKKIKEEIAELDGKASITNAQNELDAVNKRINELVALSQQIVTRSKQVYNHQALRWDTVYYKDKRYLTSDELAEYKMLLQKREQLTGQVHQNEVDAWFSNLTGIDNDTLEREIKRRKDLLAKMALEEKEYGRITQGVAALNGTYSRQDLQYQLNKLTDEQNRRNAPTKTPAQWAEETKRKYESALAAYNNFIRKGKGQMSEADFAAKAKELKEDLDAAKKEYDKYKPQTDSSANQAQRERQQLADKTSERQKAISEYSQKVAQAHTQAELDIRQATLDAQEDSYEKEIAQINLNYDRLIAENGRRQQDMLEALAKNKLNEWLLDHPKATQAEQNAYLSTLLNPLGVVDKDDAGAMMTSMFNGNADLLARPLVDAAKLVEKGWKDAGEGIATVFSIGYDVTDKDGKNHSILVSPILPNGDILTEVELDNYIDTVLSGAKDILSADKLNIVLGVDVPENAGEILHQLQEIFYFGESESFLGFSDLTDEQRKTLQEYADVAALIKEQAEKKLYERLLKEYQDYEARRTATNKKFDDDRRAIESKPIDTTEKEHALAELERKRQDALKAINNEEANALQKTSSLFVDLFADAADKSDKEIRKIIKDTKELLSYLNNTSENDITANFGFSAEQLKSLKASPEQIKAITEQLQRLIDLANKKDPFRSLYDAIKNLFKDPEEGEKKKSLEAKLKDVGEAASECAGLIGGVAGKLADMFEAAENDDMAEAFSAVEGVMNGIGNIANGFAQGGLIGGIAAVVGEGINLLTSAFQADARHAEALKKLQQEITAQQRAYNLALLEESLAMKEAVTVFGNIDYKKASNAVNVMKDSYADLRKEMANIADIEIKTGHKNTGLFGWGKGKDLYSSLLDVYPELIDSQGNFNRQLAESILNSREFKGEGKEALQYMIDLYDQAEAAYQEMKDFLTGIFGGLGNTMSDALVDAFKNGTDAAESFADSVGDMLEKLGQQMIFSTLFGTIIQQANEEMIGVMTNQSLTEEQKFNQYIAVLDSMTNGILGQQDNFNNLMKAYQDMAAAKGLDLWGSDGQREASQKGIAQASQDSVDELNGRATAIQGHTYSISENTRLLTQTTAKILESVINIDHNTKDIPDRLRSVEESLSAVKSSVNDIAIKGIKLRT